MVEEILIPAREAKGFTVKKGQTFRIVAHEGPQVCDAVFIGREQGETYSSDLSVLFNQLQGTGNMRRIKTLYSRPPGIVILATVEEDRIGHHFPWAGGMCSSLLYEIRDDDPDHANCADNLLEALHNLGYEGRFVSEVFNIGMNVTVENHEIKYHPPEYEAGDFIELRAERDLLVALSACPNDTTVMNEFEPKSLLVEIEDD